MKKRNLDPIDRKDLRYQCRMGIVLPLLLLFISSLIIFFFVVTGELTYEHGEIQMAIGVSVAVMVILSLLLNRKYLMDLRNGEKILEEKTVQTKEMQEDFEAGSGMWYFKKDQKSYYRFDLIIENTRYRVEEKFFAQCEPGTAVIFHIAPRSRHLLQITLADQVLC